MLVLSRQRDETIMIAADIAAAVVDVRGDKIRLGITAPSRIAVHRKEVYEAIRDENERAARIEGELEPIAGERGRTGGAPRALPGLITKPEPAAKRKTA